MSVLKTIGAYSDCQHVMDQALARGGLIAEFKNPGKAINFRQRCYKLRALLYDNSAVSVPLGMTPYTPYDNIFVRHTKGESKLEFCLRSTEDLPTLIAKPNAQPQRTAPIPPLDLDL